MAIHYNVPGKKRKELAQEISTWLGCEVKYLGAPTFAYKIGFATIDKEGNFTVESTADEETVERLIEHLYDAGFEDEAVTEESRVCVTVPETLLDETAEANLKAMTAAKNKLFKKAFGVSSLAIEHEDGQISFPWLKADATPEEINAFDHFICAFIRMAKEAKRVTAKEKEIENEKYAMRCFLLRLGFIGNESKEIRKTLLKNLSGSSAFKSGKAKEYRVELDGDNFRIFTAKDSAEADRLGMEIAEELGSEFCEVSEVNE